MTPPESSAPETQFVTNPAKCLAPLLTPSGIHAIDFNERDFIVSDERPNGSERFLHPFQSLAEVSQAVLESLGESDSRAAGTDHWRCSNTWRG